MSFVYDALETGQDSRRLAQIMVISFFDAVMLWYILVPARSRRPGPVTCPSTKPAAVTNRVGWRSVGVLIITGIVSAALIVPRLVGYWHDRSLMAAGHYMTVTGQIEQDVVIKVYSGPSRNGSRRFATKAPHQLEWDRIRVDGKSFVVQCVRPTEASFGVVGIAGACLDQVEIGSDVQIDYLPNRIEPLRIESLDWK